MCAGGEDVFQAAAETCFRKTPLSKSGSLFQLTVLCHRPRNAAPPRRGLASTAATTARTGEGKGLCPEQSLCAVWGGPLLPPSCRSPPVSSAACTAPGAGCAGESPEVTEGRLCATLPLHLCLSSGLLAPQRLLAPSQPCPALPLSPVYSMPLEGFPLSHPPPRPKSPPPPPLCQP